MKAALRLVEAHLRVDRLTEECTLLRNERMQFILYFQRKCRETTEQIQKLLAVQDWSSQEAMQLIPEWLPMTEPNAVQGMVAILHAANHRAEAMLRIAQKHVFE